MKTQFLKNCFGISHERLVLFVAFVWMRELEEFDFLKLVLAKNAARAGYSLRPLMSWLRRAGDVPE